MEVKEILKFIENKEKELSTYKETDKEIARNLCSDKNKKIIEFNEIYAIENVLNRLEQLEKENIDLKQKIYALGYSIDKNTNLLVKMNEVTEYEPYIPLNSIPKSEIRDKIEELKQENEEIKENEFINCSNANTIKIKLLKEILGEEKYE